MTATTPAPNGTGEFLLGPPSFRIIYPPVDGLPPVVRIDLGSLTAEIQDPVYCREVAAVWNAAAQALTQVRRAAADAHAAIGAQLEPLPALPVGDAS